MINCCFLFLTQIPEFFWFVAKNQNIWYDFWFFSPILFPNMLPYVICHMCIFWWDANSVAACSLTYPSEYPLNLASSFFPFALDVSKVVFACLPRCQVKHGTEQHYLNSWNLFIYFRQYRILLKAQKALSRGPAGLSLAFWGSERRGKEKWRKKKKKAKKAKKENMEE